MISPSWNFPAQAELSYEDSKPSQAELVYLNFRAETELAILTICTIFPHIRPSLDSLLTIVVSFFENPNPHFITRLSGVRIRCVEYFE